MTSRECTLDDVCNDGDIASGFPRCNRELECEYKGKPVRVYYGNVLYEFVLCLKCNRNGKAYKEK